eukprot:COSAG01_NODE_26073_length_724_cov_1.179200_1_plen_59_part_10
MIDADPVLALMRRHNCDFDEARLRLVQDKMRANGIDPDTGLPLDPKALQLDGGGTEVAQ